MRAAWFWSLAPILCPVAAQAEDFNCNNGIVSIALHLDRAEGTVTMEGASYHVSFANPKLAFSATDPAGDRIDYVLDRAANLLVETDHDKMPNGSFKTISLTYTCTKAPE